MGAQRMDEFTVMTFNLLMLSRGYAAAAASIAAEAADVVALQELTCTGARELGARLGMLYPYQALRPEPGYAGAGLVSRLPILDEQPLRLSKEGSCCQYLTLALPGGALHFYNIHLMAPRIRLASPPYDPAQRDSEAQVLAKRLAGHPGPLVVVGDFNMTPGSTPHRLLTGLLADTFVEAGSGSGATFPNAPRIGPLRIPLWPAPWPILRLDYVFHSEEVSAREVHLGDGAGSDHRPVIARLAFA